MSTHTYEYQKQWKQKRIKQGLCYRCGNKLVLPYKQCPECRAKSRQERGHSWYVERKSQKYCPACSKQHTAETVYCLSCRKERSQKRTAENRLRKKEGICYMRSCHNLVGPESTMACHDHYQHLLDSHRKHHDQAAFGGNRKLVLERDNHQCVVCYSEKKLEVHHKDEDRQHNDLDNLVTLCHKCHVTLTRLSKCPNIKLLLSFVKVQDKV